MNDKLNIANEELKTINDELYLANSAVEQERIQFLSILDSIPELKHIANKSKILKLN